MDACGRVPAAVGRTVWVACRAFPLGAGDGHALAGAHADEIGFEIGEGGEGIEKLLFQEGLALGSQVLPPVEQ